MKKIVIIGANDFQNPLILKARELGYETHVFAWREGAAGEETADFFYPVSIVEKDEILEICRGIEPDAVASIGSDLANITVQYLAKNLGLRTNSDRCILYSTNKYEMRKAFQRNQIPTPGFWAAEDGDLAGLPEEVEFPVIVKPTDRSGSRAITKVTKREDLKEAVEAAIASSFEKRAVVEEYMEGDEYSCEGISFEGRHSFLAITKKYTTGAPHFIETGHRQPSGLTARMEEKVKTEVQKALDALEIRCGASHTEFRINARQEVRIIEIGSRMGGDCIGSHLVGLSTGQDYVRMVIDAAAGREPQILQNPLGHYARIQFILGKRDMERYHIIRRRYPSNVCCASHMEEVGSREVVDSGTRYGFYIITARDAERMGQIETVLERV